MGSIFDKDFFKTTKKELTSNLYFLHGSEKFFITKAYNQLLTHIPDLENNLSRVNGAELNLDTLEDLIESIPFLVQRKAILVKDCDIEKLNKNDLDKLISIVKDIPEYTLLIFCHATLMTDPKKMTKHKKLFKEIEKNGITCEFKLQDKTQLKRALVDHAKKQDMVLDMQEADMLIERTTLEYIVLINELDKCIHFAKSKGSIHITKEDIFSCTTASVSVSIYDLSKNILTGNYDRANAILQDLIYTRVEPVIIVASLSGAFCDLYRAKCGVEYGVTPKQVQEDFKYQANRLFVVTNSFSSAKRYSTAQIRACIDVLYQTDIKLKSSKMDNILLLEKMLADICLKISRR